MKINLFTILCILVLQMYFTFSNAKTFMQKMADKSSKQRWCGRFDVVLELICLKYPEPDKRSYTDYLYALKHFEGVSEDSLNEYYPSVINSEDNSLLEGKFKRDGGIYDDCCKNPCSLEFMEKYYCENN